MDSTNESGRVISKPQAFKSMQLDIAFTQLLMVIPLMIKLGAIRYLPHTPYVALLGDVVYIACLVLYVIFIYNRTKMMAKLNYFWEHLTLTLTCTTASGAIAFILGVVKTQFTDPTIVTSVMYIALVTTMYLAIYLFSLEAIVGFSTADVHTVTNPKFTRIIRLGLIFLAWVGGFNGIYLTALILYNR